MTPREADIAFVLEPLAGVTATYSIDRSRPVARHFDFAVQLEHGGRTTPHEDADVLLVSTMVAAFDHLSSRPVDLLIVSATMRADGGEPVYRPLASRAGAEEPERSSRSA